MTSSSASLPAAAAATGQRWGWLPLSGLITQRFDAAEHIRRTRVPVLVVHGSEDRLIPPELGRALFDKASTPKRFLLVEGGSHHNTNALAQAAYREALAEQIAPIGHYVRGYSLYNATDLYPLRQRKGNRLVFEPGLFGTFDLGTLVVRDAQSLPLEKRDQIFPLLPWKTLGWKTQRHLKRADGHFP